MKRFLNLSPKRIDLVLKSEKSGKREGREWVESGNKNKFSEETCPKIYIAQEFGIRCAHQIPNPGPQHYCTSAISTVFR
jgi:hypothetical protein